MLQINLSSVKSYLQQALLEENFNDLFQQWQQASVVNSDAALEKGQDIHNLGEPFVIFRQRVDGIREDSVHQLLFIIFEIKHDGDERKDK